MPQRQLMPAPPDLKKSAQTPQKQKRQTVAVACKSCQRKKVKCDGLRPACSPCSTRDLECVYELDPGQTRTMSLKTRVESQGKELEAFRQLYAQLLVSSPEEMPELLQQAKTNPILAALPASPPHEEGSPPREKKRRALSFDSNPTRPSSTVGRARSEMGAESPPSAHALPSFAIAEHVVDCFYRCSGRLFHAFPVRLARTMLERVYSKPEQPTVLDIASLRSIMAIACQYMSEDYSEQLGQESYEIARGLFGQVLEQDMVYAMRMSVALAQYNVMRKSSAAVTFIELGLGVGRRLGANVRECPSAYTAKEWSNIRRVWRCLVFMDSWLCSTLGLSSSSLDDGIFELLAVDEAAFQSGDLTEVLPLEMSQVSLLTSRIVRALYSTEKVALSDVHPTIEDLERWYETSYVKRVLQPEASLLHDSWPEHELSDFTAAAFIQLLRNNAVVLIYRRILFDQAQSSDPFSIRSPEDSASERMAAYSVMGPRAARSSARIIQAMLDRQSIFRRCWLIIGTAFTSAIVLLQHVSQHVGQHHRPSPTRTPTTGSGSSASHSRSERSSVSVSTNKSTSSSFSLLTTAAAPNPNQLPPPLFPTAPKPATGAATAEDDDRTADLQALQSCLAALAYCAVADRAAAHLHATLSTHYENLRPHLWGSGDGSTASPDPVLRAELLELVQHPFGKVERLFEQQQEPQGPGGCCGKEEEERERRDSGGDVESGSGSGSGSSSRDSEEEMDGEPGGGAAWLRPRRDWRREVIGPFNLDGGQREHEGKGSQSAARTGFQPPPPPPPASGPGLGAGSGHAFVTVGAGRGAVRNLGWWDTVLRGA